MEEVASSYKDALAKGAGESGLLNNRRYSAYYHTAQDMLSDGLLWALDPGHHIECSLFKAVKISRKLTQ